MPIRTSKLEIPEGVELIEDDCLNALLKIDACSIDAVVTDPPYDLEFMGKEWDRTGVAFQEETWRLILRVLKPGGYLLTFGGTRTYHRLTCAVEDAGFEILDCLMWLYGTGFPKGKGCLKPAWEPILLARRVGKKTESLGIDQCRIPIAPGDKQHPDGFLWENKSSTIYGGGKGLGNGEARPTYNDKGRYPANVLHDGSDEVLEAFAAFGEKTSGGPNKNPRRVDTNLYGGGKGLSMKEDTAEHYGDSVSVSRFFYTAKASRKERGEGNAHPTVKPLALVRWLVRLVCPAGRIVLDPFLGSGTTALACLAEGRRCIGIEKEAEYMRIAQRRIKERKGVEE